MSFGKKSYWLNDRSQPNLWLFATFFTSKRYPGHQVKKRSVNHLTLQIALNTHVWGPYNGPSQSQCWACKRTWFLRVLCFWLLCSLDELLWPQQWTMILVLTFIVHTFVTHCHLRTLSLAMQDKWHNHETLTTLSKFLFAIPLNWWW